MNSYKASHSFEARLMKCKLFMEKEPDKFILIAQRHPLSKLPDLPNPKLLCPKSYKCCMMRQIIMKKIVQKLGRPKEEQSKESFYVFIGKHMPPMDATLGTIYDKYKDPDGILYVTYQELESF